MTGYGPFPGVPANHTGTLALSLGSRAAVLEVSYAAVDAFLDRLDPDSFDAWLALGRDMRATGLRVETLGRNKKGREDVRGVAGSDNKIDIAGPDQVNASLFDNLGFEPDWMKSDDAGDYLCNYVLYRAQLLFPQKRIGFLHLPPVNVMPMREQRIQVKSLMDQITRTNKT